LMNVLAATIAGYGLFANSPAVIIGAMIVAMLLGPIAGVALSLLDSDMRLLLKSLVPPLSSASILFAHGEMHLRLGAFFLTFTNMVGIQFASSVALWCNVFRRLSNPSGRSAWLFLNLKKTLNKSAGSYLTEVRFETISEKTTVGKELSEPWCAAHAPLHPPRCRPWRPNCRLPLMAQRLSFVSGLWKQPSLIECVNFIRMPSLGPKNRICCTSDRPTCYNPPPAGQSHV